MSQAFINVDAENWLSNVWNLNLCTKIESESESESKSVKRESNDFDKIWKKRNYGGFLFRFFFCSSSYECKNSKQNGWVNTFWHSHDYESSVRCIYAYLSMVSIHSVDFRRTHNGNSSQLVSIAFFSEFSIQCELKFYSFHFMAAAMPCMANSILATTYTRCSAKYIKTIFCRVVFGSMPTHLDHL